MHQYLGRLLGAGQGIVSTNKEADKTKILSYLCWAIIACNFLNAFLHYLSGNSGGFYPAVLLSFPIIVPYVLLRLNQLFAAKITFIVAILTIATLEALFAESILEARYYMLFLPVLGLIFFDVFAEQVMVFLFSIGGFIILKLNASYQAMALTGDVRDYREFLSELSLMVLLFAITKFWQYSQNKKIIPQSRKVADEAFLAKKLQNELEYYKERDLDYLFMKTRLEVIESQGPNAIILANQNGIITHWNKEASRLMGYSPQQAIGKNINSFFVTQEELNLIWAEKITEGASKSFTTKIRHHEGHLVNIKFSAAPFQLMGKKIYYLFAKADPLHDEREVLKEMTNRELNNFAHAASHDLKEPLRMINSFAQLLQRSAKDQLSESGKEYLTFISDASRRMNVLIQDLSDYTTIGINLNPTQAVNLNDTLLLLRHELLGEINEQKARIVFDDLPTIIGHSSLFGQVFRQLISNSLKFKKPGEPLQVHIRSEEKSDHLLFSVSDNGIGVDPEYHSKIFDVFCRLHPKSVYEGSGIGLAACKKIIENYGGKIWIESALGQGSTIFFTLPQKHYQKAPVGSR